MRYMKGYMSDGMPFFIVSLVFTLVIGGIIFGAHLSSQHACSKKSQMMGLQSDYGWWTGCMVKVGDRYFPRESIRLVNGELVVDMAED